MVDIIQEIINQSGTTAKKKLISEHADDKQFRLFLYYACNPLLTYNLSEETLALKENEMDVISPLAGDTYKDIFNVCEGLSRLRGVDDATVRMVKAFLYCNCAPEERDIYIKVLAKTLRLGVTAKSINKVIPNLLPEWDVQQSFPLDKYPVKDGTEFWLSEKLNGVRATYYRGSLIARSGVAFNGLSHILNELDWARDKYVLDGELEIINKNEYSNNEAFRIATGILNSDSVNKTTICFTVFDIIPINDFESSTPRVPYSARRELLNMLGQAMSKTSCVAILPSLYHGADQKQISILLDKMVEEDKEGLILNTDVPYMRKRHKGILKIKRFYTMDLPIVRCEEGSGRLAGTLGAFVLDFKGNEVKVGTGFDDEQRKAFWERSEDLVGTLCEVKYKEISKDKKTKLESLQFPVFVSLRDDKTDISYG